jgi:hypothetical protein
MTTKFKAGDKVRCIKITNEGGTDDSTNCSWIKEAGIHIGDVRIQGQVITKEQLLILKKMLQA